MKTSDRGIAALIAHEGIVPGPYLDSVGVWTFGVGHTAAAGGPDPATMARGMPGDLDAALARVFAVFAADLARYEADVARALTVPVAQHEFDALVSFHYNTGAIATASLTRLLNDGNRKDAATAFLSWRRPAEIIPRRTAEAALFATGVYPDAKLTVWQVDGAGRVIWSPARTLTAAEAVALIRREETDAATGLPILRRGSRGEHVRLAQARLVGRGYSLTIDGDFGPATELVVRRFQLANLLRSDGVVGPLTWDALNLNQGV